ncbi:MAG: glycosyltransferase family 9 protein [Geobacteraceae bacterium]|nr:glycosyltransferase family 9 protein [Geobacteraceae bacterium]
MNWKLIRIIDSCLGIPLLLATSFADRLRGDKRFPNRAAVKRILLIKFWGIGNIFMILPSIQALRAAHPEATLDFLTLTGNEEALAAAGVVDSVISVDTGGIGRFISSWRRAVSRLKQSSYDIIVDFEQFARFSALVAHQIGAREVIGFETRGQYRSCLYTRPVAYDNTVHITRSFYALAAAAGATTALALPYAGLARLEDLRSRGRDLLAGDGITGDELVVVMHIGTSGNFSERRWLPERYAELADLLIENFRVRIVFTGLAEESSLVRDSISHLHFRTAAFDLSGQLSFADYFALITVADLVISADTAAVHLASAVDAPVVGLYGPNTPALYGPWGRRGLAIYQRFDCSPCITNFNAKLHICRHAAGRGACMRAITVADAFELIRQQFFAPEPPGRCERLVGT